MNRSWSLLYILLLCTSIQLFAYNPSIPKVQNFNTHPANFVENKGQLADENGRQNPDIKYYIHDRGVNVYCRLGKISFVFTRTEETENAVSEATGMRTESPLGGGRGRISGRKTERETERERGKKSTTNRADLVLIGSNPAAQILASNQFGIKHYFSGNLTLIR